VKFSIVTPSYNQGPFIERTVESVLSQRGDFELEYFVVDGGSTDETLAILRRYEGRLRFVSERDRGQTDAINKGFRQTSGDVLAWLNSDDTYAPGALDAVARTLRETGARWCYGRCPIIDEQDREIRSLVTRYKEWSARRYSLRRLVARNFISQPATFFRRELLDEVGPVDGSFPHAMDYDLWLRFARVGTPAFIDRPLAHFRWHGESITGARYQIGAWEAYRIASRHARGLERAALASHLAQYVAQVAAYRVLDLR
jgi:glycosyltransferase involved in cell wall biosynthesis